MAAVNENTTWEAQAAVRTVTPCCCASGGGVAFPDPDWGSVSLPLGGHGGTVVGGGFVGGTTPGWVVVAVGVVVGAVVVGAALLDGAEATRTVSSSSLPNRR